jgi:hypothetical protein
MRYPNTRYGNPTELRYYTQGLSAKQIAKQLKRSEKSVTEWLNGTSHTVIAFALLRFAALGAIYREWKQ